MEEQRNEWIVWIAFKAPGAADVELVHHVRIMEQANLIAGYELAQHGGMRQVQPKAGLALM